MRVRYDQDVDAVAIELLDASKRMTDPATFDFQIKTPQHT